MIEFRELSGLYQQHVSIQCLVHPLSPFSLLPVLHLSPVSLWPARLHGKSRLTQQVGGLGEEMPYSGLMVHPPPQFLSSTELLTTLSGLCHYHSLLSPPLDRKPAQGRDTSLSVVSPGLSRGLAHRRCSKKYGLKECLS